MEKVYNICVIQDKKTQLPEFLKPYFWDVALDEIDLTKHSQFVLKRVLDRGDTRAVLWGLSLFSRDAIEELITTSRDLSRKTANFWAELLDINKKRVPCLQKPYSRIPYEL